MTNSLITILSTPSSTKPEIIEAYNTYLNEYGYLKDTLTVEQKQQIMTIIQEEIDIARNRVGNLQSLASSLYSI